MLFHDFKNNNKIYICAGHSDTSPQVLLREILYAFQGIQGQVFYWDATNENLLLKHTVNHFQ